MYQENGNTGSAEQFGPEEADGQVDDVDERRVAEAPPRADRKDLEEASVGAEVGHEALGASRQVEGARDDVGEVEQDADAAAKLWSERPADHEVGTSTLQKNVQTIAEA